MTEKDVPEEFQKIMKDFYRDILTSFPEYKDKLGDIAVGIVKRIHYLCRPYLRG